jgi:ribonuclease HI
MPYRYESELREEARRFAGQLSARGIEATIVDDSARDYTLKLAIARDGRACGLVSLYYSPTKDQFSLRTPELRDPSILADLEAGWAQLRSGAAAAPAAPSSTACHAYVDGAATEAGIGFGVVIVQAGGVVFETHGRVEDADLLGMRQVGGELQAVHAALQWCLDNGVAAVAIHYDFAGIEKWATGEWQPNRPATRAYADYVRGLPITIEWHKVVAHSGDRWNERADQLARQGARPPATTDPSPEADVLAPKATAFVAFLEAHGLAATYRGILNRQFARVTIEPDRGCVDVYNSRKRPLARPYLHGFSDPGLQRHVETLWQAFLHGGDAPTPVAPPDWLAEATYYYHILLPYRRCHFDFSALAQALERACRLQQRPAFDAVRGQFDFDYLEAIYLDLKGATEPPCPPSPK